MIQGEMLHSRRERLTLVGQRRKEHSPASNLRDELSALNFLASPYTNPPDLQGHVSTQLPSGTCLAMA